MLRSIDRVASSGDAADWLLADLAGRGLGWPSAVEVTVDIVTASRTKIHSNVVVSREHRHGLSDVDEVVLWSTREEHRFKDSIDICMNLSCLIEEKRVKWGNGCFAS